MAHTESLWPTFDTVNLERDPRIILKEQAMFLEKATKNVLSAEIRTTADNQSASRNKIIYDLQIVAPLLSDYRYNLLEIEGKIDTLYPLRIVPSSGEKEEVRNEREFIDALERIFKSEKTKKIISVLLARSIDIEPLFLAEY